jgi:hypothetical protein
MVPCYAKTCPESMVRKYFVIVLFLPIVAQIERSDPPDYKISVETEGESLALLSIGAMLQKSAED